MDLFESGVIGCIPTIFVSDEINEIDSLKTEADPVAASLESDWLNFLARVEAIFQLPELINSRNDWKELIDSPILMDLQYRQLASERIFSLVADDCLNDDHAGGQKINDAILKYLVDQFQWDDQRYALLARFGLERADAVFSNLDKQSIDYKFRLAGAAATLIGIAVVVSGYFSVSFLPWY